MKKFWVLAVAMLLSLLCSEGVLAQHNFGFIGGATFSRTDVREFNRGTMTQYHAGITYRARLPHGFSIQPSLVYQVKGAKTVTDGVDSNTRIGYLELPVSFQWGPDLILFRPFVDVTPFVGYGLNNKFWSTAAGEVYNSWGGVSRWEYGIGAGLGFDIWKFQLIARYNWNLGSLSLDSTLSEIANVFRDDTNFGGVTLSLAFLF